MAGSCSWLRMRKPGAHTVINHAVGLHMHSMSLEHVQQTISREVTICHAEAACHYLAIFPSLPNPLPLIFSSICPSFWMWPSCNGSFYHSAEERHLCGLVWSHASLGAAALRRVPPIVQGHRSKVKGYLPGSHPNSSQVDLVSRGAHTTLHNNTI